MEMKLPPLSECFKHLSQDQIDDLCARYPNEKNKDLVKEFELKISPNSLQGLMPPKVLKNLLCRHCNTPMWSWYVKHYSYEKEPQCPTCNHRESSLCECANCQTEKELKKEQESNRITELMEKKFGKGAVVCTLEDIPLLDRLYLAAFLRATVNEYSSDILSLKTSTAKLSPARYMDNEILEYLLKKAYIRIKSIPEYDSSEINDIDDLEKINYIFAGYALNIEVEGMDLDEITLKLFYPEVKDANEEELRGIWMRIAKAECFEFVLYKTEEVGIRYKYSQMHMKHFESVLQNFSVSQFYCIYSKQIESAHFRRTSQRINNVQTLHSSIKGTVTHAERALVNKWDVTKYGRRKWSEQSVISEVFFTLFLKIDQAGFWECPVTYEIPGNENDLEDSK